MARNYAALPHDYLEEMELLSDAEFGRICRALLKYSKDGEVPALSGSERVLFPRVRMQEDRFQESYKSQIEKKRDAGRKSAEVRKGTSYNCVEQCSTAFNSVQHEQTEPNKIETEIETKIYPSSSKKGVNTCKRFTPPTLEDVAAYVEERNSPVDPQGFIDFYEAKGWLVGKTPMKDWKAACRNAEKWERWSKSSVKSIGPSAPLQDIGSAVGYMERMEKYRREMEAQREQQGFSL